MRLTDQIARMFYKMIRINNENIRMINSGRRIRKAENRIFLID